MVSKFKWLHLKKQIIREVNHPAWLWLSNVVLIKKAYGPPGMCVAFTNLNDVCPKDYFPLPRIEQLVNTSTGFNLMSFLNTYFCYHRIKMHPKKEGKNIFYY